MSGLPSHWLVPEWPLPPGVQAACSVREGGVSAGPYASLNLGDHVGDDSPAVAHNRDLFRCAISARPVFLRQLHGSDAVALDAFTPDAIAADACWTVERGVACTILVADCLPVLFADSAGRCVAAAHAGWRGLAGDQGLGVLESLWACFWPQVGSSPQDAAQRTLVWLGPCIGRSAFEVGPEVKAAFQAGSPDAARRFLAGRDGKWLADLAGLARDRLAALGLRRVHGNDGAPGWCTVSDASRFFSHRRDRVSGRFAAAVWLC